MLICSFAPLHAYNLSTYTFRNPDELNQKTSQIFAEMKELIYTDNSNIFKRGAKSHSQVNSSKTVDNSRYAYIKNFADANIIKFLAYIAGINLNPQYDIAGCTDPAFDSIKELYEFYKDIQIYERDLYLYWVIFTDYNLLYLYLNTSPEYFDSTLCKDENIKEYIENNPNSTLALKVKLTKLSEQQYHLIKGVLKSK